MSPGHGHQAEQQRVIVTVDISPNSDWMTSVSVLLVAGAGELVLTHPESGERAAEAETSACRYVDI